MFREAEAASHDLGALVVYPRGMLFQIVVERVGADDQDGNVGHALPTDPVGGIDFGDESQGPLEEVDHLGPQGLGVLRRGDDGATAGEADAAAGVGVADVDEVFGFGGEEGLEAVAAGAAPDLADVVVVAGEGLLLLRGVVGSIRSSIVGGSFLSGHGMVRTHPLLLEKGMLQVLELVALLLLGSIGVEIRDSQRQRLLAHDADPAEVIGVAFLVEGNFRVLCRRDFASVGIIINRPRGGRVALDLFKNEWLRAGIDGSLAMKTHETLFVISAYSRQGAICVNVDFGRGDGGRARMACVRRSRSRSGGGGGGGG
mmetsp:Transcript_10422/g.21171  ORF Transcript_10422/g.21171 Transcript_10422/m.21171 type:complete len:314 (-) Transcript_10422:405-1346(-)